MQRTHILIVAAAFTAPAAAIEPPCTNPQYAHGYSYIVPLKYPPDFEHFEYANPDAPKGGRLRLPEMGTYDNFNNIVEKGRLAKGLDFVGSQNVFYDRLLTNAIDEPASYYGRLAEGIAIGPNQQWVAFKLRAGARWHDEQPITAHDVVFSFEAFKQHGSIALRTALTDLDRIFAINGREVCLVTRPNVAINRAMPITYGVMSILPRHYWERHDISKTTTQPPLGSGPYRFKGQDFGRSVTYERIPDYWGKDIPVNKGRFNWNIVKWDYFRDENVMLEAHKADVIDIREEGVSKNWATGYNFPAVQQDLFKAELRYITRVWGLWWPILWNLNRPRFQDVRVREALWLLYDFTFINRALLFNFYDQGRSFFQNSPMAHLGLPSKSELALLEPWRDQLPPRVFTQEFKAPEYPGYGSNRENIKRALELFEQAGWVLKDGEMKHRDAGEAFEAHFIFVSPFGVRAALPYINRLNGLGIRSTGRAPEVSQWLYRMRTGSFDGGSIYYVPSKTPGIQLRNWLGSAAAEQDYGQNFARIKDPVVDYLIDKVITASTAEALYTATRALDRVILWNFYFIPGPSAPGYRLAYWDRFGEVRSQRLSRVPFLDTWWWDESKARRVAQGIEELGD